MPAFRANSIEENKVENTKTMGLSCAIASEKEGEGIVIPPSF